jgi:aspartyl aminopeptidase
MTEEKTHNEILKEQLFDKTENAWKQVTDTEPVFSLTQDYKRFLMKSKTERLCTREIIHILESNGFKQIDEYETLTEGTKFYKVIKEKSVIAGIVGNDKESFRLIGSHVDAPRLDLKPNPLYEKANLTLLKSHYYGGIKKYQWVNTPLALHGVAYTKDGERIDISIGEHDDDPQFIIPDLLPHLARNQMEREAKKIVEGEELNILVGNIPVNDKKIEEQIKLHTLKILHEQYGISEQDFKFAEFEAVPANKPRDIGFDRALIASYAHDDRVCVYTSLRALLLAQNPRHTPIAFFVDKEEIGSVGNTGADSFILYNFAIEYCTKAQTKQHPIQMLEQTKAISADVTGPMNPNYADNYDPQNTSYLGKGISVEKYGGGGGKYSTVDTHAEYMAFIRDILTRHAIPWQTGELGKVDLGGGGTIGMFMARFGMDIVDAGPSVLGMHSPCEVVSKVDIYSTFLFYKAFFSE